MKPSIEELRNKGEGGAEPDVAKKQHWGRRLRSQTGNILPSGEPPRVKKRGKNSTSPKNPHEPEASLPKEYKERGASIRAGEERL